jgi:nitric oxide reductase subunit B
MKWYWIAFAIVLAVSFGVLGATGVRIYQEAPPIPERVMTTDGRELLGSGEISAGQNVWQSLGGMELGSVWGHGSYVAPDWTADWLHREATFVLERWASEEWGRTYAQLEPEDQAALVQRLTSRMHANRYDPATGTLTIDAVRAQAFDANVDHYTDVFENGRHEYALARGTLTDPVKARQLSAFFFWSAWAAAANRPDDDVSYTNNWPSEPLVGNKPAGDMLVWTGVSIILLLAGIGAMATWHAMRKREESVTFEPPTADPLLASRVTPSQRALVKYFWATGMLLVAQIMLGVVTAHYGVEGSGLYGIPLDQILPYTVTRTWHLQLGIFWIATAWLATGLYVGPAVGHEPRGQKLGVDVLFVALVVVIVGSMAGQWLSVKQLLGDGAWFWFGHSGYEYIDLGRFWQILLLIGLFLWLFLVTRSIWPALRRKDAQRPLLVLFVISAAAIASFYFAALGYGRHTNLAIAEYWRWWVVHLWVEGFFEVFATVVIAFLLARLGLIAMGLAARAAVLSATIFLSGGIIGTLHHLYFSGTPTFVLALGSVFSALEVVPLVFVGFEAWENLRLSRARPWVRAYRWPILYFVAVAFWNLVGAGLFGFMLNPPIALYYMQGLNTTAVHGHAALFGVYGMLGIGLVLFCLRAMQPREAWSDRIAAVGFWSMNLGLLAMIMLSTLPIGLMQTWASVEYGYEFARSPELMQQPVMSALRWLRVPGDTLFAFGALVTVAFIMGVGRGTLRRGAGAVPAAPHPAARRPGVAPTAPMAGVPEPPPGPSPAE